MLGREVLRRNVRHHLKTEPIRVRGPFQELNGEQGKLGGNKSGG